VTSAGLATLGLMGASVAYWLLALAGALKLLLRHEPEAPAGVPPVTVLKPVKGLDPELAENCLSFCRQDYPDYQVIFGVADPADPSIPVLRQVLEKARQSPHRLVIGPESYGPNRKISLLQQMLQFAAHDIIVISDSDVRVGPDYLRAIAPPFLDPQVGLVTCLYRGDGAEGLAAHLEAWAMDDVFAPSVMAAYAVEGVTFAFGSTLALRRKILDATGGFAPFVHLLAEDYHLAQAARRQGYRLVLCRYPVACILGRPGFGDVAARLLRWSRTHRACRPGGYFLSGIGHATIFALLHLIVARLSVEALAAATTVIGVRAAVALLIDAAILRSRAAARRLLLLLPGDLVSFAAWALSFAGNRIEWRGHRYRIERGGRLAELGEAGRLPGSL